MFVPLKWIKDYVNIEDINIEVLCDALVMSGSKVEAVKYLGEGIENVVVGKILEVCKHPDADKLFVTKVDVGTETIQIVTGANNIREGQYVPIVLVGGLLPGGNRIEKGKLRGIESDGMMCSAKELNIPDKVIPVDQKDGIFILDQEYPLGKDIKDVMGLNEHVIEFEITPNRPDCLSILGMAREVAATFNKTLKYPEIVIKQEVDDIHSIASVDVRNKELCVRYVARAVKDVKIGPSPLWLQTRLMAAGMRPINNMVDVTNYVMLEVGQPMHAFDLDMVEKRLIIVNTAKEDEMFTTLDGVTRKLDNKMLMICDGNKPVGIAGVMGGENSEIVEKSTTILLESANFYSDNIRKTSKKLGLRTEASSRYEKGIDPNICLYAVNRACQLIEELEIGKVVKGTIDIYPKTGEKRVVEVRPDRVNALLGTDIELEEILNILRRLEIEVECRNDIIEARVPTFRLDLLEEIDFVEEVARIYGFDNLPITLPKGNTQGLRTNGQIIEDYAKNILTNVGLNEILTYSFVSPKGLNKIGVSEESIMRRAIRLINPLGEETSTMRTTMMPNMLEVLARNYNRNVENVKAFEIGRIFIPYEIPVVRLPIERHTLSLGMYGDKVDFYVLKGVIETLLRKMGIKDFEFLSEKNHSTFHPGRCASVINGNHLLGVFGEVNPDVCESYGIDTRVYLGEMDFNIIMQLAKMDKVYKGLAKYPAIIRDIAMVVKDEIFVKQIEDIIKKNGQNLLESVELFDVYKGKQIQQGHKSVAYTLTYRAEDRTLTDEDLHGIHGKILKELNEKLGAVLRE